ncbi:ABC transporter permease [Bacillus pseudomycoides]|uniref:ABC transporter permease n=1 Tax=Bacillus pseudomycoides TaxID=64104 RepID=UPI003000345A
MNSFSIAFSNFKRNIKVYGLYVMSMIFTVFVYYNFIALKYNPDFQRANESTSYIESMSTVVSKLLLLFIIFFIWFASSFFLSQRKKEIGIYAFMGVTNTEIALIYSIELVFIGVIALIAGLFLGVIFCKLFLMMLAKVAILNMKIRFFISFQAILETTVTFFIIFFINAVLGYINIVRSKLIDLLHASKREEQYPKVSYVKGVLSIISIAIGYYFAKNATGEKFITNLPLAVTFVVIGTYLLFGSVYSIVMGFIIGKKRILYNGVNIVSISNIAFRIKNNYRTLAAVAILVAITLTSYGTVASLKYYVQIRDSIQSPYAISYISDDHAVKQQVREKLKGKGKNIILEENIQFLLLQPQIKTQSQTQGDDFGTAIIKYSDLVRVSKDLKANKQKEIEKTKLSKGEALYLQTPGVVMSLEDYENLEAKMNGKSYIIKSTLKTPLFGNGVPTDCLILNDEDYNVLKNENKEYEFNGMNINNTDDIKMIAKDLANMNPIKDSLHAAVSKDASTYSLFGIIYFLGAFLALVFIVATGSIIYFKVVSEAYIDKDKYKILRRIGMTDKEIHKAVIRQVGISYSLPLIVGMIHSCVAMSVLSKSMNYNIIIPSIISVIVFIVIYGVYFIATTRKYLKIVG